MNEKEPKELPEITKTINLMPTEIGYRGMQKLFRESIASYHQQLCWFDLLPELLAARGILPDEGVTVLEGVVGYSTHELDTALVEGTNAEIPDFQLLFQLLLGYPGRPVSPKALHYLKQRIVAKRKEVEDSLEACWQGLEESIRGLSWYELQEQKETSEHVIEGEEQRE